MKTYGDVNLIYTENTLPNILKWVSPNSKVLEFGPAMGYMTRYMKEILNCKVTCIELNVDMAKVASQYAEHMIVANLDNDDWSDHLDGTFDYIILGDVLEHLRNPSLIIKNCIQFLSPKGFILTSIPNIGHSSIILSLMDGDFEYQEYGLLDSSHIHFFTRKSINAMMNDCGLICIEENNNINPLPGNTEFYKFYITHISGIFSCLRKKDTAVYQFVQKWGFIEYTQGPRQLEGYKLSFKKSILVLLDDLNDYIGYRFNHKLSLPLFLKKLFR
ncbi:class I SAM-dependent methyltransferase [Parabacteroides timonensis]|uniref:class I SAM-dependent methyltransferase n=1 Tax=Parabacteroides timonensis TaxID=1871013 RepID=UPI00094ECFAB|nr:class I SAM-dependent methyltransferase [Parabacteroides timonensis]